MDGQRKATNGHLKAIEGHGRPWKAMNGHLKAIEDHGREAKARARMALAPGDPHHVTHAIRRNQTQSDALRSHQKPSEASSPGAGTSQSTPCGRWRAGARARRSPRA